MSSATGPVDLGFLSQYVVNTSGQLNDSVGAIGSSSDPAVPDSYEFSYPGGLQQVTITLTYSAASGSQGDESKSIVVAPASNLSFVTPGGSQNVFTESAGGSDYILSNQYSVDYNVTSGNPGVAYFDVYAQDMTNAGEVQAPYAVTVYDKYEVPPVCFASGTQIRVAYGGKIDEVPVESLASGDIVVTSSGAHRPIRWLGHRTIERPTHEECPVRILAGAFGLGLPAHDLRLSPGHPVLVGADEDGTGGVLVPIMCLINGTSVARLPCDAVTYWHVELDTHDILLAEGLPAESYLDWGDRPFFDESSDHALHNPDFIAPGLGFRCRPVVLDGPIVEAKRQDLTDHFSVLLAAQCEWPSTTSGLSGGTFAT